ncbi:MAG: phosphatidate cytidylyltransferase [Eggerthellaceae bacterium]|nr:phosphatidate cytidylyltransferase [Eggerthellaceae bacterium]
MADPQVRRSFDSSIPKYAPGSVEVKARIVQGEQGAFFESVDVFEPCEEGAQAIDDADGKRAKKRSERIRQKALDKMPQKLRNPSNLQVRVRTGVIYITVTVICMLISDATAACYLALLSAICAGEFYYMLRSDAKLPNEVIGITAAALFPFAMWLFGPVGVGLVFAGFCLVLLVWYVFWLRARIADVAVSLFGALYTGMAMSLAMLIKMAIPGLWGGVLVLGIFLSIWGNDAFAYLIGSAIGKHKLAPAVSPKKSWEGFIAGLIFSMGLWCALMFIPGVTMSLVQALIFGFICGVLGVLGDLVESRIKRNSGFKDSGTIMPGHGGLLDRCDSQFLVTVSAALLLIFGGCIPYVWA